MRFSKYSWAIRFAIALVVSCGVARSARASLTASDSSAVVSQIQAFINDFGHWDSSHQNTPLTFLATAPDAQKSQALTMLWLLWQRDHLNQGSSPSTNPGTNNGGGTVASFPDPPPPTVSLPPIPTQNVPPPGGGGVPPPGGGGHTSGDSPEPTSLALFGCGSLSLLAYRLVRARRGRKN